MIQLTRQTGRVLALAGLTATFVIGGLIATGGAAALAANEAPAEVAASAAIGPRRQGATRWTATSPTTHLGDRYQLTITNGATAQRVIVRVLIMDHQGQQNTVAVQEILQLAPGEKRSVSATNGYGTANHFHTGLGTATDDLTFEVSLTDASGQPKAWFNQSAFHKRTGQLRPLRGREDVAAEPVATPGHPHR